MMDEIIRKSDYKTNNYDIGHFDETLDINLTYPNLKQGVRFIQVNQESVRASDGIRLFYDYDRDGWVIEQPTKLVWAADETEFDNGWKEVAFIQTRALREEQRAHEKAVLGYNLNDD